MSKHLALIALSLLICCHCFAQNTANCTVMYYNLLRFPDNGCYRVAALKVILQEISPDILMVSEMNDSSGVIEILQGCLNVNGNSSYRAATYVPNGSGPDDLQNMMFYNSDKFTLVEQNQIPTGLRDINHYRVYANDSTLSSHHDTPFLNIYVGHLKAGPGSGPIAQRKQEVDFLRAWIINNISGGESHLLGADLNVYGCSEPAYQCLMHSFPFDFEDPINSCGEWHDDPAYASIHTQSTRCTNLCSGASGGVDDRFDQILVSEDMTNRNSHFQAIPASYAAFGNPGTLFNSCFGNPSLYPTLPPAVVAALYDMSDHFPVVMDLEITFPPVPVGNYDNALPWKLALQNPVQDQLRVFLTEDKSGSLNWEILSAWGTVVDTGKRDFNSGENQWNIPVQNLAAGTYFLRVEDRQNYQTAAKPFFIAR